MNEIGRKVCGYCGLDRTPEGYDGCLGTLPNAMNACCGHGGNGEGVYIQYWNGTCIRHEEAVMIINKNRDPKLPNLCVRGD